MKTKLASKLIPTIALIYAMLYSLLLQTLQCINLGKLPVLCGLPEPGVRMFIIQDTNIKASTMHYVQQLFEMTIQSSKPYNLTPLKAFQRQK